MYSWLPENVDLKTDISGASWVVQGMRPWGVTYPQPVACFLPDTFEAYARVLHPGREYRRTQDGSLVVRWTRWSELGARRRVDVGAATRWEEVSGFAPQAGPVEGIDEPYEGSMPDVLVEMVAAFVRRWTTTPEETWFGMWDGNGTWWKGAHGVLVDGDDRHPWLSCYVSTTNATGFSELPPRSGRRSAGTSWCPGRSQPRRGSPRPRVDRPRTSGGRTIVRGSYPPKLTACRRMSAARR